ncbi:MAG: FGGY-family carbohydrate kinase, partial [Actinocatenispora sp.]
MPDTWLGIDVGTQGARAVIVDDDGAVRGQGAAPIAGERSGARHEQDPSAWRAAVADACRQATAPVDVRTIRALAVCATSGTIALVDGSGRPLTTGLMYDDGRARDQAARVAERGGSYWSDLGYRIQASWALPKLLWLLGDRPDLARTAHLVHQSDVVTGWLAGHPVPTDWSHALKTGYDPGADGWPGDLLDDLGVPARMLPDVVAPGTVLGTVCAARAADTGIPAGVPVVAGMTDGCAAQIAADVVEPGDWNCVLGTTLVFKGVTTTRLRDPGGLLYSHRAPDGRWLPGGASSVGAGVITELFPGADLDALTRAARRYEPAGPVLYPLVSRGERFPFLAPDAERFSVPALADDGEHFAAILQGVGYAQRLAFDYIDLLGAPVEDVYLTGGGSRNAYWRQLQADILGRPVYQPAHAEAAFGMAVLAAGTTPASGTAAGASTTTATGATALDGDRPTARRLT